MVEFNAWAPSGLALIAGLILGVIGAFTRKSGIRKTLFWFAFPLAIGGIIVVLSGANLPQGLQVLNNPLWGGLGQNIDVGENIVTFRTAPSDPSATQTALCPYQPTGTYSPKDKFSSLIIGGGTAYYKVDEIPATTTSITNLNKGTSYTYWYSNATTSVKPKVFTAECGANDVVADSWQNATVTLTAWDSVGNKDITKATTSPNNITLGANGQANVKVTFQGTAKKSAMPFGGLMVVEYNSTISDVTCTGDVIKSGNPSEFHLTFSPSTTNHVYKAFEVGEEIDDGSGNAQTINCQFLNGATAQGGTQYFFRFIGANYYLTNNGDIVLDTEKNANQDTARTGLGTRTLTAEWQ